MVRWLVSVVRRRTAIFMAIAPWLGLGSIGEIDGGISKAGKGLEEQRNGVWPECA